LIRLASKFDVPALVEMIREYSKESGIDYLRDESNHDQSHVEQLLLEIIAGKGFVLIDSKNRGMLAAIIVRSVWSPSVLELRELAWFVQPEHRGGSVGGRLFLKFDEIAKTYLEHGRAKAVFVSLRTESEIKSIRGFRKIDSTFFKD